MFRELFIKTKEKAFEKVNPSHPDKVADRIAGAIVDMAYAMEESPKIAVEVLIGHSECNIIIESDLNFSDEASRKKIGQIVKRISGLNKVKLNLLSISQDEHLANNQQESLKCGDNGIFKGVPVTKLEKTLTNITKDLYSAYPSDGKYILSKDKLIICQSKTDNQFLNFLNNLIKKYKVNVKDIIINPLGYWEGGVNVDCGATNRKLGSDLGLSVTGGGLHGKDLSKGDVSINIYAWLEAQKKNKVVEINCAIGDKLVDGKPYQEIIDIASNYIKLVGGFEKFAEYGLINEITLN